MNTKIKEASNKQIRKLGQAIRSENGEVSQDNLVALEKYRASFKAAIFDVFTLLNDVSSSIRHDSITTYRIKRIESIIKKLRRFEEMQLDRMGDIAGCRCILNSDEKVYKLLNIIKDNFNVKGDIRDYKLKPQKDGYRSIHLYVTPKSDIKKTVEIQLRTKKDHNWATLVEILDLLYDKSLKEGQKDNDFEKFHYLMSIISNLNINDKIELIKLIHKHRIFNVLRSVFVKNYLKVRLHWLEIKGKKDHFYIVEASKDTVPIISTYEKFVDAEKDYFNKYLAKSSQNIVLTYLAQPNFQNLETAYSNYTLTTHTFLEDYFNIIEEVTSYLIEKRRFIDFYYIYCDYVENFRRHFHDVNNELEIINNHLMSSKEDDRRKIKYWKRDFIKRFKDRIKEASNIRRAINREEPKWGLYWILFKMVVKFIEYRKGKHLIE